MVANTGSRPSRPLIRSIFATSGRGAMRPKPHPAASAWLAIRTKAPIPRASQKDTPVRVEQYQPGQAGDGRAALGGHVLAGGQIQLCWHAHDLDPRALSPVVWFSPGVIVVCRLWSLSAGAFRPTMAWWPAWMFRAEGPVLGEC